MVDNSTASAAEALILRLLDAKGQGKLSALTVVGVRGTTQTFGKGVSQQTFELGDGSAVMFTVSRWSPEGFQGIAVDRTLGEAESAEAIDLCGRWAVEALACPVRERRVC